MNDQSKMMKMIYRQQQRKQHILTANEAASLFEYVEIRVEDQGCDHSRRFTKAWLKENVDPAKHDAILNEMADMGGFCDCEITMNCYEDYDL